MAQPWFRFYSEALRDRKLEYVCRITSQPRYAVVGIWATLLALGNDSPDRGALLISERFPVTLADLARDTEMPEQDIATMLEAFERLDMIARVDGIIVLCNWDKRQFASDHSTGRVRALRAKRAEAKECNGDETLQTRSVQQHCNGPDQNRTDHNRTETERESKTGDTPPILAPPPALPAGIPDPSALTVAQIKKLKLTSAQWDELGDAEMLGKGRSGVDHIVTLKTRCTPPAIEVFRDASEKYPLKPLWSRIIHAVGEDPRDLEFWKQVVTEYIGMGWNPKNVKGMLGFYERRELPEPAGARSATSAPTTASGRWQHKVTLDDPRTDAEIEIEAQELLEFKRKLREKQAAEAAARAVGANA